MGDPVSQSNPDTAPPLRPEDAASVSPEASDPAIQNDPTKSAAGGLIPFRLLRARFASLLDLTNSAQKKNRKEVLQRSSDVLNPGIMTFYHVLLKKP